MGILQEVDKAVKSKSEIMYDCYDENEKPIGIIFAKNCRELLEKNSDVRYVRGMDAVTRRPNWHEVTEGGLVPYKPKVESHAEESSWSYDDLER